MSIIKACRSIWGWFLQNGSYDPCNMKNIFSSVKWILVIAWILTCSSWSIQSQNIKNDRFWNTVDGQPIYSQGGGIFRFVDPTTGIQKYYWYGVHYKEAEWYRNDPAVTQHTVSFVDVTCYTSTDLVHWTAEKPVLDRSEIDRNYPNARWLGRMGVAYVKDVKQYALFIQLDAGVLIAVSDSPKGPFKWHQRITMTERIGTPNTGDQTVFTDEDSGKSYLVYSFGKGRNKIYLSEIGVKKGKVDLLDCKQIYAGAGREGNCMFKYKGKYYMYASNLYGWDASFAYYLVADHLKGPYRPENDMRITPGCTDDFAHVTQTGFFYTVKGSEQETVVYCGDRWADFAGNGYGYNQWCPLSFDGETPYFNSLESWNLNAAKGTWEVANDNNYVKNGSFEADRRRIPSLFKPIQQQLTGWATEVLEGNPIGLDTLRSPVLNFFNTESDRKVVIGEKSLRISDKIPFKRRVHQLIASSLYVRLEDGVYLLKARVKNNSGFSRLEMYASSAGISNKTSMNEVHSNWTTVLLPDVRVTGGKVEVGFLAEGAAGALCLVDDVSFVKQD